MSGDDRVDERSADLPDALSGPLGCEQIQAVLIAYLARELGASASTLVREHLRHCTACTAEAASVARTLSMLKAGDPGLVAPAALSARRRRRVLWAWAHPLLAWCVRRHHWVSLAAAILALLAVLAVLRQWRMSEPLPKGIGVQIQVVPPTPGTTEAPKRAAP
jgi:hypothetical protein